jgi:hypothetical protein
MLDKRVRQGYDAFALQPHYLLVSNRFAAVR